MNAPQGVTETTTSTGAQDQSRSSSQLSSIYEPAIKAVPRLDPLGFPDQGDRPGARLPTTILNIQHLLAAAGISVGYDVIKKRLRYSVPNHMGTEDNVNETARTVIASLMNQNNLSTKDLDGILVYLGDRNEYNPAMKWIRDKPWDGSDRLKELYSTLTAEDDFPVGLKECLMLRWLLGAVAAACKPHGFRSRDVLTLQGAQGLGKTAWVRSLVPGDLGRRLLKLDHHMDAANKDSLLIAVAHWIVEIGELDGSLRRNDIARLKGFLTSDSDVVRKPYAAGASTYPRRTVFAATVNDANFLPDLTGNTRFWVIPVVDVRPMHELDMQQVFAQAYELYKDGEQWHLTDDEERLLETCNSYHQVVSPIYEKVLESIGCPTDHSSASYKTASAVLISLGIQNPTAQQARECGAALRKVVGEPKKVQGSMKWRVALKTAPIQYVGGPSRTPLVRSDDVPLQYD